MIHKWRTIPKGDTHGAFGIIGYDAYGGLPGPRLIITGAIHGNERCGTEAITRVMAELDSGTLSLRSGLVTFVPVANPLAYANNTRNGDRNLNRHLFPSSDPHDFEDHVASVGTTEYMRSTGGYALTLECGQHDDPQAPEVAYCAIHRHHAQRFHLVRRDGGR